MNAAPANCKSNHKALRPPPEEAPDRGGEAGQRVATVEGVELAQRLRRLAGAVDGEGYGRQFSPVSRCQRRRCSRLDGMNTGGGDSSACSKFCINVLEPFSPIRIESDSIRSS